MKVIVTGATGFVGAALARRLLAAGHEVHAFIRQTSPAWRIQDIRTDLREHAVDLRDASQVDTAVQMIRPDITYHCATYGGFAEQRGTLSIMETNFLGTVHLLRASENAECGYFVNTGSSSEYGIKTAPMNEGDLLEPIDDYGVSKAAATLYCSSEGKKNKIPIVTLRLFSPFGPWDDPRRFLPYVIKSRLRGDKPKLSDPASVRDYVFIDDVLDAYLLVVKQPFSGDVFNIGSGIQHSLGDVVSAVQDIIPGGPAPAWDSAATQRREPNVWVANVNKARELFDWKPSTELRTGLERTIRWMKEHLGSYP